MARPAPGVERTVAVLDFLAARSTQSFGLSELARELDLNKATAHATLTALVDAGYLLRLADKSFRLGPAVLALARAAEAPHPAVDVARAELDGLAADLRLEVLVSVAHGDEIVVMATGGSPAPLSPSVAPGQRLPLVPPLGTVFTAWAEPEEIDEWLSRVGPSATEADRDRYRAALSVARERGYAVGLDADARQRLAAELAHHGDTDALRAVVEELGHDDYLLVELEHARSYRVNHVGVPVFGPAGEVAAAITAIGVRDDLTAADVPAVAARLQESARRVTAAIGGQEPTPHTPEEAA